MLSDQNKTLLLAVPAAAALGVVAYFTLRRLGRSPARPINPCIRKDEKKVMDAFDIEDLMTRLEPGQKVSLCRCWLSEKWPYCDGAHKYHNQKNGDNVGPVNVYRKKAA
ncbi:CDGSH iron-sulfur domain-containing protein 1 [Aplysia californica]|uniref:CDGSH iron-sulfur domain-containing protein 1 n=1 Tax=Aplysia californica TaxID=6500 RepID=A0ABM0KA09_APLCA|nr:CDGSH iron-sulfur domain-containing protein 1 [Aplysia californica]